MNNKVIQSYVWHENKCFFVSTINRECSAILAYGDIYAETMVWECDTETRKRGNLVWQGEDVRDGIDTHISVCRKIHETGNFED